MIKKELEPVQCRCGGEVEIFHIAPDEGCKGSYCVRCSECLIQTPFFKDKEKAIMVWNRAMGTTEKSSAVERTAKVIEHDASITDTDGYKYHRSEYLCSACKKKVISGDDYCSHCGVKLDWGGHE